MQKSYGLLNTYRSAWNHSIVFLYFPLSFQCSRFYFLLDSPHGSLVHYRTRSTHLQLNPLQNFSQNSSLCANTVDYVGQEKPQELLLLDFFYLCFYSSQLTLVRLHRIRLWKGTINASRKTYCFCFCTNFHLDQLFVCFFFVVKWSQIAMLFCLHGSLTDSFVWLLYFLPYFWHRWRVFVSVDYCFHVFRCSADRQNYGLSRKQKEPLYCYFTHRAIQTQPTLFHQKSSGWKTHLAEWMNDWMNEP